jgi:hypothetical protein
VSEKSFIALTVTSRPTAPDRRVFPPAYEAVRPFFDPATQWGNNAQEHFAYRTLADHFPQFSAQERLLIVITAKRLFQGDQDPF